MKNQKGTYSNLREPAKPFTNEQRGGFTPKNTGNDDFKTIKLNWDNIINILLLLQ